MVVNSQRFGRLEISEDKILVMAKPILGFEKLSSFCLIERAEFYPFLWMQSIDDPAIAFVIVNPALFDREYHIEINPNEISELEPTSPDMIDTYVITNFSDGWKRMTINLQGPILINTSNNKAKQLIIMNSDYKIQQKVFELDSAPLLSSQAVVSEPVEV